MTGGRVKVQADGESFRLREMEVTGALDDTSPFRAAAVVGEGEGIAVEFSDAGKTSLLRLSSDWKMGAPVWAGLMAGFLLAPVLYAVGRSAMEGHLGRAPVPWRSSAPGAVAGRPRG